MALKLTARDEQQVHHDTFIEEYPIIKLVFLTNTKILNTQLIKTYKTT